MSPRWIKVVRDLWDNKSRTLLVVLSISVGVIAFGGLFATRSNLLANLTLQFEESDAVDLQINIREFGDELVRWTERQPGVLGVQGLSVHSEDLIVNNEVYDVILYAFDDLDNIAVNRIKPEAGSFTPGRGDILIERSYLERIGINIGDVVVIETADERRHDLNVTGTIHDINIEPGFINDVVKGYISTRTLERLGFSTRYNTLYVRVDRSMMDDLTVFSDQLLDDLTRYGVVVNSIAINDVREHWATDNINGLITILIIVGFFALLLSGFLVVNTISGFLAQQKKQIGVMKIIGASRNQIIAIYMVMVMIFGILAVLLAIPLSSLLARGLVFFLGPNTINFDVIVFRLPVFIVVLEITVALLAPLISALGPILSGTRVTAAEAISDYAGRSSNNLIDILLAKVSGFPTPYLISLRNTFRRKIRLLMTLITLVLAGAFFMAIMNVRAAVQTDVLDLVQMRAFDVQAVFAGTYDLQGTQRRVLDIPGVVGTEGWLSMPVTRVREGNVESAAFNLTGVTYDSMFITPDMYDGRWLSSPTEANRYDVVIGHSLLDTETDIEIGDTITIASSRGKEQDWRVIGMVWSVDAPGSDGGIPVYSYYDSVSRFVDQPNRMNSLLIKTDGTTYEAQQTIETRLKAVLEDYNFDVAATQINLDLTNNILEAFDVIISLLIITATMIAIVGGLGLAGTMSLSVLERTREIGVMRSVGATTNTLRLMFIGEGVIIGVISFIVALAVSIPATIGFATALGNTIRERPWSFVLSMNGPIIWLVIILVVSTIASLLPAQRATQISIREALSYE